MKILKMVLLFQAMSIHAIEFTQEDMHKGYNRVFQFNIIENSEEQESIKKMFDKESTVLKDKITLWCTVCQEAKNFDACLAKMQNTILADPIEQLCARNVVMAKIESLYKVINAHYFINEEGFNNLIKLALFDTISRKF